MFNQCEECVTETTITSTKTCESAIIDPSEDKVYIWTFKILKPAPKEIKIGIVAVSTSLNPNFIAFKTYTDDNDKGDDVILMKLHFHNSTNCGSLYFCRKELTKNIYSNQPYEIVSDQIMKKIKYKMAISVKNGSVKYFPYQWKTSKPDITKSV